MASQRESSIVGINTKLDKAYEAISRINLSPDETLWYDGVQSEMKHRVIETKHSRGYVALSPPKYSSVSFDILYSARVEQPTTIEDGVSTFTDYVSKDNEDISNFSHSPEDSRTASSLRSGKDLPSIRLARSNDSFYYLASSDAQKFVGLNNSKWGPFNSISQSQFTPKEDGLVYAAEKTERWAVHENETRGQEFDQISRLRFTLDSLFVRYEAKQEKESFAIVNKEVYQSVSDEKLNPNRDLFIYQGKKSDKWHQVIQYEESEAQKSLSKAVFTPDGHGVETIAKSSSGSHLLYKHYDKSYQRGGAYSKASTSVMKYLPYTNSFTAEISEEYPDSIVLKDREGTLLDLSGLENVKEKLFLALGYSSDSPRNAWLIKEVKDGRLVLHNTPTQKELNKALRRNVKAFVLPVHAPFTYRATKGKDYGLVFEENHYKELRDEQFTINRNLVMRGKVVGGYRLVFEGARTKTFPMISSQLYFHPSLSSEEWVAIKTFDSSKTRSANSQLVLTNKTGEVNELGYASSSSFTSWTDLSANGEHTVVWSGSEENGKRFEAVGPRRFDAVRKVGISPNLQHLNFVASKDGMEFVYHKQTDHTKYGQIREYTVAGPEDNANYIGRHVLSRDDGSQVKDVITSSRFIERVSNGEQQTSWFERIHSIQADASLADTSFVGYRDGFWSVYAGNTSLGETYESIEWYIKANNEHHFIGKKSDGWHEIHNMKSVKVSESILPIPTLSKSELSGLTEISGQSVPAAYVTPEGQFLYMSKDGMNEKIHIPGESDESVRTVLGIWALTNSEGNNTYVFMSEQRDGQKYLHLDGLQSEPFDLLTESPNLIEETGEVFSIVNRNSQENKRFDALQKNDVTLQELNSQTESQSELDDYLSLNNILRPQPVALLKNTMTEVSGLNITLLEAKSKGVVCSVQQSNSHVIYHSGVLSESFDTLLSGAYWGETLTDSRFLVGKEEDPFSNQYLFSKTSLLGPFESATLEHYPMNEQILHVVEAKNHHQSTLYINEVESGSADSFAKLSQEGRTAYLRQYDDIYNFKKYQFNGTVQTLGDNDFAFLKTFSDYSVDIDDAKYSLMLRLVNDKITLQHGTTVSEIADLAWDLQVEQGDETIQWSWLDGDIDYESAKVSIKVSTLSIPTSTEPSSLTIPESL